MTHQPTSIDQLITEINNLRQENDSLQAQVSFHKRIFQEMKNTLGVAGHLNGNLKKDDTLNNLLKENQRLKSEMKIQRLSSREKEILGQILQGHTSKQIAERLSISKLTVDTHRKNIQNKLEVSNTVELIRIGLLCNF